MGLPRLATERLKVGLRGPQASAGGFDFNPELEAHRAPAREEATQVRNAGGLSRAPKLPPVRRGGMAEDIDRRAHRTKELDDPRLLGLFREP